MANGITGKTAVVTGASRGIGAATCRMLAREGAAKIVVHYHSYREGAEALAKELEELGTKVVLIGADLGSQEGIAGFVLDLHDKAAGAQILINNAGHLVKRAKLAEFTSDIWDEVMNLNAKSVYFVAQAPVPGMVAAGGGAIINLSSIAARNGGGGRCRSCSWTVSGMSWRGCAPCSSSVWCGGMGGRRISPCAPMTRALPRRRRRSRRICGGCGRPWPVRGWIGPQRRCSGLRR